MTGFSIPERRPSPRRTLRVRDASALTVGIVVGSGIFFMPTLVAASSPNPLAFLGLWLVGGLIALVGALCYAELTTTYPDAGGDYHLLTRAFGSEIGFLFAWGRMTVIQTGSLAAAALIAGNYLADALPSGSPALYAASLIVLLTGVNLAGIGLGKGVQNLLTGAVSLGLIVVALAGILAWAAGDGRGFEIIPAAGGAETGTASLPDAIAGMGLAMVFVLYTYGGWNEAAYLSAEIKPPQNNIARALLLGVGAVTVIYLLVNLAFLAGLGLERMASSNAVAADLLRTTGGDTGAILISALVVLAVLSTINATIITGGRSNYAMGRDFPGIFGIMGRWEQESSVPSVALVVQAGIALLLVGVVPLLVEEGGIEAMVAYTAPVFWFFFFMVGLAVLILRTWDPQAERPFRVPVFPLTPIVFCLACLYMFFSSIAYAGLGSLLGVGVLLSGLPFLWLSRNSTSTVPTG